MSQFVFLVNDDFYTLQNELPMEILQEYNDSDKKRAALEEVAAMSYALKNPYTPIENVSYICTIHNNLPLHTAKREEVRWLN